MKAGQDEPVHQSTRSRLLAGAAILLVLAALAVISIWTVLPPRPVAADAPATAFSAERAFAHVERVGSQVHVTGSPAAAEVRQYIADTLTEIGLEPEIQETVGYGGALSGPFGMATVRNVVAVIPGTAPTGSVFLFAHFDSVQVSYGGNDDGAGVATLLETARAVRAGPPPVNDLVFLFTDAEEACLCGSEAFVSQHPLAAGGGIALNFESRGSTGPAIMFETSQGNADVVGVYGSTVPYPVATSFAAEVYRILPNDTDFTPFRDAGSFTGLNTAYIDGSAVYHSPQDRPDTMDLASLQQHGSNAVALAEAFGAADIATLQQPAAGDSTYFPVLGGLLRYPGWLVWPLAVLALLAVTALAVVARRRDLVSWPRVALGFGAALLPLLLSAVVAQLFWLLLVAIRPGYANMDDPWWPGWFRACVVALVATIVLAWYGLLRRRIGAWSLAIGGLAWLAVIGIVLAAATPGGSYLAALPALVGATASLVAISVTATWIRLTALGVGAAVAVLILAPTVYLFFPALGLATGAAGALFAAMLGLALLPVLELIYPPVARSRGAAVTETVDHHVVSRRRLWTAAPALTAGVLAVACLGAGLAIDHFDAQHPAPAQLAYVMDADTGQAQWISTDTNPGEWVEQYVTGTADLSGPFGLFDRSVGTGPAQPADLAPPEVTVVVDSVIAGRRMLSLTISSQRSARLIYFDLPDATVLKATVGGREVPADELGTGFGVAFHGPPTEGLTVDLELESTAPTVMRVMDGTDGLDGLPGFTPRPPDVGIQGSHTSELVVVATSITV